MKTMTIYFDANRRAVAINRRPARFAHEKKMQIEDGQEILGKLESEIVRESQALISGARYEREPVPFGIRHMGIHWITDLTIGLPKPDQRSRKVKAILKEKSFARPADVLSHVHFREEEKGYSRPVPR